MRKNNIRNIFGKKIFFKKYICKNIFKKYFCKNIFRIFCKECPLWWSLQLWAGTTSLQIAGSTKSIFENTFLKQCLCSFLCAGRTSVPSKISLCCSVFTLSTLGGQVSPATVKYTYYNVSAFFSVLWEGQCPQINLSPSWLGGSVSPALLCFCLAF